MQELWKPVNFGTNYQVSSKGRVRNLKTGKVLAGHINEDGYAVVCLSAGTRHWNVRVHTLVMLAFAGPRPDGKQVRHLDGDPANNQWAPGNEAETTAAGGNLIYGTPKENCEDRDEVHGRNGHANKTHCGTCGEPYDEKNTYIDKVGARCCRNCVRASNRRWEERNPGRRAELKRQGRARAREERSAVWLTTGEAADLLGCSTETIRRWCRQGTLRSEQPKTSHLRVYRSDVEARMSPAA
jgi:excisionase family DNA binding protein